MDKEWNTMYSSIGVPLTLFLGSDLLPLIKENNNTPLIQKTNELIIVFGFDKINIYPHIEYLEPLEYAFDSYGKVLIKETVTFEEATNKILQSLEKVLLSDNENILAWKKEIEETNKKELTTTYSATIDGIKKENLTPNDLSKIFRKGSFNSILLDKGKK